MKSFFSDGKFRDTL